MSTLSATPNADGSVTLNAGSMPKLVADIATYATATYMLTDNADTVMSTTQLEDGSAVQMAWTKTTSSYASVYINRSGLVVGDYYAFRWRVKILAARPGVPGDVVPPLEVWLDSSAPKPWGEDEQSRTVLWQTSADDGVPPYIDLWLFVQAQATTEKLYLRFRPLYPYVSNVSLYIKDFNLRQADLTIKKTTPRIFRTDQNGRRELDTPYMSGKSPTTTAYGPLVDREAALTGSVLYELIDTGGGVDVDATATTTLAGSTPPVALSSNDLAASGRVELVTNYSGDLVSTGKVHQVVDRADPVVVTGPASTRQGTLELFTTSRADAEALLAIVKAGTELLLRTRNDMDIRLVPQRASDRPAEVGEDLWQLQLDYVEVL